MRPPTHPLPLPHDWDGQGSGWLTDAMYRLLLRDEDLPVEPWASLAQQYRTWSDSGLFPAELSPLGHALGRIGLVATLPLEGATKEREALAREDEKGLLACLSRAVLDRRRAAADDQD